MAMIPKKTSAPAAAEAAVTKPVLPQAVAPAPVEAPAAVEATATASAAAPAAAPAPAAIAVRPANAGAVAVAGRPVDIVAQTFKDAFRVDWNTLHRIQANNGNFLDVESNKASIGGEIVLEVLSYQDNWQISPGTDDDSDLQYVRYSEDGQVTTQGENCHEYVRALIEAGYNDAKLTQRLVIAGTLVGGPLDGKLIQLNLPPTSKAMFDRFKMQASLDIAKSKRDPSALNVLKLKAVVQSKGKFSWTVVQFDYAA